jgi:hypothetical protein
MNILFLCGGLEPGKDGVGDYSRRLAVEIIRQGHQSTIIAINDASVDNVVEQWQNDGEGLIKVLRLPTKLAWSKRYADMEHWIEVETPDWISLQFVPFAFHKKGLPISLAYRLKRVGVNIKWHIMFHELWVGEENIKFWILAKLQKSLIASLLKQLRPSIIHTHLPLYQQDLKSIGAHTHKLPLFSNFQRSIRGIDNDTTTFRVGFFNQVSTDDRIFNFLGSLYHEALKKHLHFEIVLIGGATACIRSFGDKLEKTPEFRNKICYTGFLGHEEIPPILAKCNIGMTGLTYSILGKSGTSAAFLSQGIPLAVPIIDTRQKPFFDVELLEALVTEPDFEKIASATIAAQRFKQTLSLSRIAGIFLNDLTNSYKHDESISSNASLRPMGSCATQH